MVKKKDATSKMPVASSGKPAQDEVAPAPREGESTDLAPVVGGNLRRLRTRRGLSLERLAQISGVSRAMLGQIELGQSAPTINVLWKIARALDIWRERSAATFVDTYRKTVADHPLWPGDARKADRLLDFFLLEKAFYEIGYELAHRPEWLRVPLTGIVRILSAKQEVPA